MESIETSLKFSTSVFSERFCDFFENFMIFPTVLSEYINKGGERNYRAGKINANSLYINDGV